MSFECFALQKRSYASARTSRRDQLQLASPVFFRLNQFRSTLNPKLFRDWPDYYLICHGCEMSLKEPIESLSVGCHNGKLAVCEIR